MLAQPLLGVEQKSLHRGVQERVEQAGPGAADVVAVASEQLPGEHQGHRAQQVPGVEPQQQAADAPFFGRACLAADRHDEPAGPPPGQVIDRGDQFGAQLLVTGERDRGPPVADEGIQQLPLRGVGGEPADQRGVGDEQSKAGPFALHQRVRALRGGVADVVSRLEQARQALLAVQQRGGLRQAVEQAPAQVKGSGQRLGVADLLPVDDADVGERSAVVDVNQPGHGAPSCLRADGGVRVGKPVRAEIRPASHRFTAHQLVTNPGSGNRPGHRLPATRNRLSFGASG